MRISSHCINTWRVLVGWSASPNRLWEANIRPIQLYVKIDVIFGYVTIHYRGVTSIEHFPKAARRMLLMV